MPALGGLIVMISASSLIQVFTHTGGGTVCLDDTSDVNAGTPGGPGTPR